MTSFDEYRLFVESTQFLTERRQAATRTFLTINTGIFAVLAFLVRDVGFRGWGLVLVALPLFLTGALACLIWHAMIQQYKALIAWRYDQLQAMERLLEPCYRMYNREWEDFFRPRAGKERFGFSRLEVWLPRLFLLLYLVYGLGLVGATAAGWR